MRATAPLARRQDLLIEEIEGETLVYDLARHRAHSLNATASLIWRCCDGGTPIEAVAARLRDELRMPVDEGLVQLGLQRLAAARLLEDSPPPAGEGERLTRRDVARRLGLVGGLTVLLPVVTSIVSPTPAFAATCLTVCGPNNASCIINGACTGYCQGGVCVPCKSNGQACTTTTQCCSRCCNAQGSCTNAGGQGC